MPLAKNGRIFNASVIHCRIKHFYEECGAADVKRFTYLSYDI